MFSFLKKITGGAASKDDSGCCMGKMDCGDPKKAEMAKKEEMKKMEGGCCGHGHHHEHGGDDHDHDHTAPKGGCH